MTKPQLIAAGVLLLALVGGGIAFAASRGGSSTTPSASVGQTTPPAVTATTAPPAAAQTTEAPPAVVTTTVAPPEETQAPVDDSSQRSVASQLQRAINLSHKAHDEISAHASVAGASARLGKCLDLDTATSQMENAASYRQQILDTLNSIDVSTDWPEATTFFQLFQTATNTALEADNKFAAWGYDLQSGCSPNSAQNDGNYQQASNLSDQFSAQRHLAAVEWNKLVTRYPQLALSPLPASGETL